MTRKLWESNTARSVVPLVVLALIAILWWTDTLPAAISSIVDTARDDGPSEVELDQQTRNYYEGVIPGADGAARHGLGEALARRFGEATEDDLPDNFLTTRESGVLIELDGYMFDEMKPNFETWHRGVPLVTNRWGMRDQDVYEKEKPEGTFRIALCGASNSFGNAVEQHLIFEPILEQRLNDELAGSGYQRYESLNFSRSGQSLLEKMWLAEFKTPEFDPDLILVVITRNDVRWSVREKLARRLDEGRDLYYDFLEQVVERAGIKPGDSRAKVERKLKPYSEWVIDRCLEHLAAFSRDSGIPVAILALRIDVNRLHPSLLWEVEKAEEYGLPVLRIFDAFHGQTVEEMYVFPGRDNHPTPKGHRLIADELYEELMSNPELRALLLGTETPESG
ncbi:MAG: SGNH/GDSL hydrolase family protein [Planctomycetota bacterium]|jgi:lysophospholipase L1-like esterase